MGHQHTHNGTQRLIEVSKYLLLKWPSEPPATPGRCTHSKNFYKSIGTSPTNNMVFNIKLEEYLWCQKSTPLPWIMHRILSDLSWHTFHSPILTYIFNWWFWTFLSILHLSFSRIAFRWPFGFPDISRHFPTILDNCRHIWDVDDASGGGLL